jgi:uncharacterized membrane protein HdeD (DUF308 family)
MSNSIFLGACIVFAIGAVVAIILGAMSHNVATIVIGSIVLIACVAMFISGMVDRRHLPPRRQQVT